MRRTVIALTLSMALALPLSGLGSIASGVALADRAAPNGQTAVGDWPQFHNTADHAGLNTAENIIGVASAPGLLQKWTFKTGDRMQSSPAVANGFIYAGSWDGYLYAWNAKLGTLSWKYRTGRITTSGPAVIWNIVYVGTDLGDMYALDATTGALIWKTKLGGRIRSSPAYANNTIYVGNMVQAQPSGFTGYMHALDANTGLIKWKSAKTWAIRTSPAVVNNKVYFGSDASLVICLDANTGSQLWVYGTLGMVRSSPAVGNGIVYIGDDSGQLYALDANTGAARWKSGVLPGMAQIIGTPALAYGAVYINTGERDPMASHVYAYDALTGVLRWSTRLADWTQVSPAIANGVLFTAPSRILVGMDALTGVKLWEGQMIGDADSSPAVSQGFVYYTSNDKTIYAFSDQTAPIISFNSKPAPATPSTSATFSFSMNEPTTGAITCKLDSGLGQDCSAGTFSASDLAQGTHSLTVTAQDMAGNLGTTSYSWLIDYVAPSVTLDVTPKVYEPSVDATFHMVTSENPDTATYTCSLDGGAAEGCPAWVHYYGLPEGTHTFVGTAYDAAGNPSAPVTYTWLQDSMAPTINSTGPGTVVSGTAVTFTFTSNEEPNVTFLCKRSTWLSNQACTSPYTWPSLLPGAYTFSVFARDLAGNVSQTVTYAFTVVP